MKVAEQIVSVPVPNDGIMEEVTNAYIVGRGPVVVVDPGSAAGTDTLLRVLAGLGSPPVRDIILTHAHPDHAAGANALRQATNAPVWLHPADYPVAERLGVPVTVDRELADGQVIEVGDLVFDAVLTPGHAAGHVVLIERTSRVVLAGDLVHGAGTVGIFPPFGSMSQYLDSLRRVLDWGVTRMLPGHGPVIEDGPATLRRYIEHRMERERQILDLLGTGTTTVDDIVARLYPDVAPGNRRAAAATVTAHLEKLLAERRVRRDPAGDGDRYSLAAD